MRTELALAIPGSRTDPEHWICTAAIRAWEAVTGAGHRADHRDERGDRRQHPAQPRHPDGAHRPAQGVDDGAELDFAAGMNTVDVAALELLTRHLVTTAVDVGHARREELAVA